MLEQINDHVGKGVGFRKKKVFIKIDQIPSVNRESWQAAARLAAYLTVFSKSWPKWLQI